jgi:transcriptional regulator with XRE-family HTH domain
MRIGHTLQIGSLIKSLRGRLGLSQAQYSERAGVPQPTLSRLESGRIQEPSMALVSRIVAALGVDLSRMLKDALERAASKAPKAAKAGRGAKRAGGKGGKRGGKKKGGKKGKRR